MIESVDTNVFVRLLTRDDPVKAADCLRHFERAERGEVDLYTSEPVVAEVVLVLSSRVYQTSRGALGSGLRTVLGNAGLQRDHKETILRAIALVERTSPHFVDCLCVEHARRQGGALYSYDQALDRIADPDRREP